MGLSFSGSWQTGHVVALVNRQPELSATLAAFKHEGHSSSPRGFPARELQAVC